MQVYVDPNNNRHLAIFHLGDSCYTWTQTSLDGTESTHMPLYKACNALTITIVTLLHEMSY